MRAALDADRFGRLLLSRLGEAATAPPSVRRRIEAAVPAAAAVLAPDSADAVAELLGLCTAEAWPVRVMGGGTCLRPDARRAVVVSSCRLTAVTEHEPADLVVGAEAGVRLVELQQRLRAAGQWLPIDPPDNGEGTLGGAVAVAAAGPLSAGHGTFRDVTLGVEVVTGDGRRLRLGGRVVKNVAGYDVVRLLVGSRGRLGVITHAFVRLRGLPRRDATLRVATGRGVEGAEAGVRLALEIRSRLSPDALEVLSPGLGGGEEWTVAVRLTGSDAAVEAALRAVQETAPALPAPGEFWDEVARTASAAPDHDRVSVAPSALPDLLRQAAPALSGWRVAVNVPLGLVRAWHPAGSADRPLRLASADAASPRKESLTRHLYSLFDPAGIFQRAGDGDARG